MSVEPDDWSVDVLILVEWLFDAFFLGEAMKEGATNRRGGDIFS
jgi:hypothetical protein